ncbi:hypothetical protein [Chitinimonas lacunae]|uniref:Uncharacterized protein n=1 Tax=Chitinimonas lacunae TaxID=1963018 RepID=A0ABV8MR71_9NEIS
MSAPPSSTTGVIPVDWIQRIHDGLTAHEVRSRLGPPIRVVPPGRALDNGRRNLDAVWVYRHQPRQHARPNQDIETFVGFRNDAVCIIWQALSSS